MPRKNIKDYKTITIKKKTHEQLLKGMLKKESFDTKIQQLIQQTKRKKK